MKRGALLVFAVCAIAPTNVGASDDAFEIAEVCSRVVRYVALLGEVAANSNLPGDEIKNEWINLEAKYHDDLTLSQIVFGPGASETLWGSEQRLEGLRKQVMSCLGGAGCDNITVAKSALDLAQSLQVSCRSEYEGSM